MTTYLAVCLKSVKVSPQIYIFCCADFGYTFALDFQQNLKAFLYSSKEQMALRAFLRIYSFFVQLRSSFR